MRLSCLANSVSGKPACSPNRCPHARQLCGERSKKSESGAASRRAVDDWFTTYRQSERELLKGGSPRRCQCRRTFASPGEDRRSRLGSSLDLTMDDHRLSEHNNDEST